MEPHLLERAAELGLRNRPIAVRVKLAEEVVDALLVRHTQLLGAELVEHGAVHEVLDRVLVVRVLAVQRRVEPLLDLLLRGQHRRHEVDQLEQRERDHEGVGGAAEARRHLLAEEGPATRGHAAADHVVAERAEQDRADEAAHAVHAPHVQGVVPGENLAQLHAAVAEGPRDRANQEGGPGPDEAGARGDGGQARDAAYAGADERRLAEVEPLNEHPDHHGHGRGDRRVDEGEDGLAVRGQGRATIEAKPAEPEHAGTEGDEGAVVRDLGDEALLLRRVLAGADGEDRGEGGEARRDVDDDAAGEVAHAPDGEEARGVPDPVDKGAVDEDQPEADEEQVRRKLNAVREGAGDQGRRDDGKHHLVARKEESGYR